MNHRMPRRHGGAFCFRVAAGRAYTLLRGMYHQISDPDPVRCTRCDGEETCEPSADAQGETAVGACVHEGREGQVVTPFRLLPLACNTCTRMMLFGVTYRLLMAA